MKFVNHTPYPGGLFRSVYRNNLLVAAVVARITFDLTTEGLVPSPEQIWKYSPEPWPGPYGTMDGDDVFYRGGVDVLLFGQARAEAGREARRLEVVIEVGRFRRRLLVYGDRVWQRQAGGLVPSDPAPFRAKPLTLAHAFGGQAQWDGLAVPCPDNPEGKGWYLEEAEAIGKPLPNLEDPDQLIRRWNDRPEPAGVTCCPISYGPRLRHALPFDNEGRLVELRPTVFNSAFPRMIAQEVLPGNRVMIAGVRDSGPLTFHLPVRTPRTRIQFGDTVWERSLSIDQVGIETERGRAFITYRHPFRYVLEPLQQRTCELWWGDGPAVGGTGHAIGV